jgi:hypothetical protein
MNHRSIDTVREESRRLRGGPERLELANFLFREFHGQCFWHSPADLEITEELIPFVMKGLRTYGGHRGFLLAAKLQPVRTDDSSPD